MKKLKNNEPQPKFISSYKKACIYELRIELLWTFKNDILLVELSSSLFQDSGNGTNCA